MRIFNWGPKIGKYKLESNEKFLLKTVNKLQKTSFIYNTVLAKLWTYKLDRGKTTHVLFTWLKMRYDIKNSKEKIFIYGINM